MREYSVVGMAVIGSRCIITGLIEFRHELADGQRHGVAKHKCADERQHHIAENRVAGADARQLLDLVVACKRDD